MTVDIQAVINTATAQANDLILSAKNEISGSASRLVEIYNSRIDLTSLDIDPAHPTAFVPAVPPTLAQTTVDTSGGPAALVTLDPIPSALDGLAVPADFTGTVPTVMLPSRPPSVPSFGGVAPAINTNIVFPDAPAALVNPVFDIPVVPDRVAPVKPTIQLPAFTATTPVDNTVAPTDLGGEFINRYNTFSPSMISALDGQFDAALAKFNPQYAPQLALLESKLATYIAGGTAMTDANEQALYERAKNKVVPEYRRVRDDATTIFAKRGFTMPTGALLSAMQRARQAVADNLALSGTEITIERAKLEQANIQFALTLTEKLRGTMLNAAISYHSNMVQINGQAINVAQQIVQAIVETYNIAVKVFEVKLDAYKAEVQVYEVRLKAAMAYIDLFRAEIAAQEALTNVDRAKIEAYRGRVDVLVAIAGLYRTQIEAVVSKASLEKLKIDIYGVQVQAYASEVQARTSEWQGYSAAIGGEEAKVRIFTEQVQAKRAEAELFRAKVEAKNIQIQAIASKNENIVRAFGAQWQAYASKMQAEQARVGAVTDFQKTLISAYGVANQAAIGAAQSNNEFYRVIAQIALERGKAKTNGLLETSKIRVSAADGIARTAGAASSVYAQIGGAALSGMNTLVASTQT